MDLSEILKVNIDETIVGSALRTEAMVKVLLMNEAKRQARWSSHNWQWHYNKMINQAKQNVEDQYDNLTKYP